MTQLDLFADTERLARRDDPHTSHASAAQVDLRLKDKHRTLLAWLVDHRYATDDQMAIAAVELGLCERLEQGRRLARTMREHHGLLVAMIDPATGVQLTETNRSGRIALCWTARI